LNSLDQHPQKIWDSDKITSTTFGDFGYHQWVASPYTEDGNTFYALAHSEWYKCLDYGSDPVKGCSDGSNYQKSWVCGITLFVTGDGGATWSPAGGNNANHVVAAPTMQYPDGWHFWESSVMFNYGFFHPSNIVKEGSFYYATIWGSYRDLATAKGTGAGTALMRTSSLADAKSWTFWSGSSWAPPSSWDSVPFLPGTGSLNAAMSTITFSQTANLWVIIWESVSDLQFATTSSLASPQLSSFQSVQGSAGISAPGSYSILQDPSTSTFNFASVGDSAYFYRCKNNGGLSRSVVRNAVSLSGGGPSPSPTPPSPTPPSPTPGPSPSVTVSPIYRCVVAGKHTVSQSSSCDGGTSEGGLGCLATGATGDSTPLYDCQGGDDQLQSVSSSCEGLPMVGSVGWIWQSPSSQAAIALYRCYMPGAADHFVSLSSGCEGQTVEGLLGYAASCPSDTVI
jgi:hypothetical protein